MSTRCSRTTAHEPLPNDDRASTNIARCFLAMAPNLAVSQHAMIHDMLLDGSLKYVEMATAARCSDRAIRRIRSNVRCFGNTKAPPNGVGRRR